MVSQRYTVTDCLHDSLNFKGEKVGFFKFGSIEDSLIKSLFRTMENSCEGELNREYMHSPNGEEIGLSDDSQVSVANMNGKSDNGTRENNDKNSCVINDEGENEVVSDDEYTYSEDSICSDDSCRESDVTNVTPRSSLSAGSPLNRTISLNYPIGRLDEIARDENSCSQQIFENSRENFRRMCSSANDNRYSMMRESHLDSVHSRARRRNMSFTNSEMQRIEIENQYLLKKIMAHQKPQNKPLRVQSAQPRVSSSAINRKKLQKRIEEENMMLLRRIQEAKSCAISSKVAPGYRLTSL